MPNSKEDYGNMENNIVSMVIPDKVLTVNKFLKLPKIWKSVEKSSIVEGKVEGCLVCATYSTATDIRIPIMESLLSNEIYLPLEIFLDAMGQEGEEIWEDFHNSIRTQLKNANCVHKVTRTMCPLSVIFKYLDLMATYNLSKASVIMTTLKSLNHTEFLSKERRFAKQVQPNHLLDVLITCAQEQLYYDT
jgi:hypothetical protein